MPTLRIYDFDGVLIPEGKNHNNIITTELRKGNFPQGASFSSQAFDILRANPLGAEAREWVDLVFAEQNIRLIKSPAFIETLTKTVDDGGTSIINSASSFEGVINYMIEKENLTFALPPENVFTVSNLIPALIPEQKRSVAKEVAEQLGYTNILFIDDNIKNIIEVANLNGQESINGRLTVEAIQANRFQGLEDASLIERARIKEIEFNLKDALNDPLYVNNQAAQEAAEFITSLDLGTESTTATKASKSQDLSPKVAWSANTYLEQAEHAVQVAKKASKLDSHYKTNLQAAQEILNKIKFGQTTNTEKPEATINPILKAGQGLLSKLKTSLNPKQKQEKDVLKTKRHDTLRIIKSKKPERPITVQELFAIEGFNTKREAVPSEQITATPNTRTKGQASAPTKYALPKPKQYYRAESNSAIQIREERNSVLQTPAQPDFLSELKTAVESREQAAAGPNLSKLTAVGVELTMKSPEKPKQSEKPKLGPKPGRPKI